MTISCTISPCNFEYFTRIRLATTVTTRLERLRITNPRSVFLNVFLYFIFFIHMIQYSSYIGVVFTESDSSCVFSDFKNSRMEVSRPLVAGKVKIFEFGVPNRHFGFSIFEIWFRNRHRRQRKQSTKSFFVDTAKESRNHWNIPCEIAILDLPIWILRFWLQI